MPVEIKDKSGKKVYAYAMVADTTRCGHCGMPIIDGQAFWVLDDPYGCLCHDACLSRFVWNGKPRSINSKGAAQQKKQMSTDEEVVAQFMSRPYFAKRVPAVVRDAWANVFADAVLLKHHYCPESLTETVKRAAGIEVVNTSPDAEFQKTGEHFVKELEQPQPPPEKATDGKEGSDQDRSSSVSPASNNSLLDLVAKQGKVV
jgi:hypothetical protein